MSVIQLPVGGLYVLSAPPGAGKSTWIRRQVPDSFVLSTDELRVQALGSEWAVDADGSRVEHIPSEASGAAFEMLQTLLRARLGQRLTTFVDATSLTDAERSSFAALAREFRVPFKVLIFDVSVKDCIERNATRARRVPVNVVRDFAGRFQRESAFPWVLVGQDDTLELTLPTLPHERVDVVGDVHGLLDDLMALLEAAGWDVSTPVPSHPDDRFLLFLGDLVDRGPQSIEVLNYVRGIVAAGKGECLMGNHEVKLLKFIEQAHRHEGRWSSYANAETGMALMARPEKERKSLETFLRTRPLYMVWPAANFVFCHADLTQFDPLRTLGSRMIYGFRKLGSAFDTDAAWHANYCAAEAGSKYVLFRGHIPQISEQPSVFSLERAAAFGGELVLMRMDQMAQACAKNGPSVAAFESSLVLHKCAFDFSEYVERFQLARDMERLVTKGLATRSQMGPLRLYKYSKRVFYENLWDSAPALTKARGLVLDLAGKVVLHPFDKTFNYGENGAGADLADEELVVAVDKLNGFLASVTAHPVQKGELLVTTQGSFSGDFVEFARGYLKDKVTRASVGRWLSQRDATLCFEVLHPEDPHIIEYGADMHGLHLIGVRGNAEDALPWTEEQVDQAAAEMGLRRPAWRRCSFGALREELSRAQHEGWMVRADTPEQPFVLKLKTPHYLTVKFIGRLSETKIKHMFKNPGSFKQTLDEEFFPLVDSLVLQHTERAFIEMAETERVAVVRETVTRMLRRAA